jgi:hypothetical protein
MRSNVREWTRFPRKYTIFTPAPVMHNWHKHRPSKQGDLDWSVTGEFGTVYYMGKDLLLI